MAAGFLRPVDQHDDLAALHVEHREPHRDAARRGVLDAHGSVGGIGAGLAEREREYAQAGVAAGASHARMLLHHLMPAARGYLGVQATLLLPAFILAEATLSYVGLGFPDAVPTWGTMLQDAANVTLLADMPWTLAPALAIFVVVLAVNLTVQGTGRIPVQLTTDR